MADLDDAKVIKKSTRKTGKVVAPRVSDMNIAWGLKNRLSRIFKPATGKTVMLAVDHGYFLGPTTGLEDLGAAVAPLLPHADALMPTRGGLRWCVPPEADTPIVLRVSGANSILGELSDEEITVSMEDAVRLNVSAVAISIYPTS